MSTQTINIEGIFDLSDVLLNKNHKPTPIISNPKIANELMIFVFNVIFDQNKSSPRPTFEGGNKLQNAAKYAIAIMVIVTFRTGRYLTFDIRGAL